jgi:membrane-bound serine protease (ClpP class)
MKTQRLLLGCLAAMLSLVAPSQGATNTTPGGTVYIIPIKGVIDNALIYVIRRGLNEAEAHNASAIIFDMDTPGGRLDSAEEILAMLRRVNVPTYTFVNPNAISAGAIIAMGTDHIWMTPGSKIGDAMPIMISIFGSIEEMPEAIEEKSVSYVAAMIRAAAQHKGHDPQLAEAMVRRDSEYKIGDDIISPKGRLLTLTNKDAERLVGPEKRPLLSMGTVGTLDELLANIGRTTNRRIELLVTRAEKIARLIESFSVILLALGLLGIYIEFKTPGFGLPGILGIICLAIWFWGYNIAGLAGMEELALFVIGLILIIIEIAVIPGFGFVGITGIALILISILMAMVQYYPDEPWYSTYTKLRDPIQNLGLAGILSVIGLLIASRFLPKSTTFRKFILDSATARKEGFTASSGTSDLIGHVGITLTPLHASGAATFDGQRLNVVTRGEFMEAGEQVRITETHGNRIIVEKITKE